jgi:hypothetical protein
MPVADLLPSGSQPLDFACIVFTELPKLSPRLISIWELSMEVWIFRAQFGCALAFF